MQKKHKIVFVSVNTESEKTLYNKSNLTFFLFIQINNSYDKSLLELHYYSMFSIQHILTVWSQESLDFNA